MSLSPYSMLIRLSLAGAAPLREWKTPLIQYCNPVQERESIETLAVSS